MPKINIRPKKCKICKVKFQPERSFQPCCSVPCAIALVKVSKIKQERKQDAEARERLRSRSYWLRMAQKEFNRFIRARDKETPCISCGRYHEGQYHAGHYYTTSSRPDLRFNEDNCHKQCSACNTHLSGNIHNYKESLVYKIGQERVDALEIVGRSDWTIEEIKEIRDKYRKKCK